MPNDAKIAANIKRLEKQVALKKADDPTYVISLKDVLTFYR